MNKILKQFIYWLEEEDRENWDIERYIEVVLSEQQEDIKKIIEKMKKEDRSAPDRGLDNEHLDYNKALNDLLEKL